MKNIMNKINGMFDKFNELMSPTDALGHPENSNALIEQIHEEFDVAQERLMDSASKVLKELNIKTQSGIEDRANLHEKLGFVNSKIVAEHKTFSHKLNLTKETAELINYYKQKYPFQKFLTEEELNRICAKYNLIYAPVANYLENVPVKNLKEISASAQLDAEHSPKNRYFVKIDYSDSFYKIPAEFKDFIKSPIEVDRIPYSVNYPSLSLAIELGYRGPYPMNTALGYEAKSITIIKTGLFIAAPKQHFNLKEVENVMGNKFGYATTNYILHKDPVVFRYCKGGIQVLSKWGLEASDELVVNEKMN